jgi:cation diffusion facilitator family transporter
MSDQRFQRGVFGAWVGIIGNASLALMKGIVGWLSGSKALMADAVNSASDVAGSVAVLVGLKAAKLPPDDDHPYGHGKAESISAIIVSILVIVVGVEMGLSAIRSIVAGVEEAPAWYALVVIVISIAIKEFMFRYSYRLGKQIGSQAMVASAWDHRSDVFASAAALLGVGGAMLGDATGISLLYYLDPAAGVAVSGFVIFMGTRLVMDAIHNTMDHVMHAEDAADMLAAVEKVRGVIEVNDLRAREHGHYVIVDLKISVNPRITVLEGHDIAKNVKQTLLAGFPNVSDVFVHVNPYDAGYPYAVDARLPGDDRPTILH